MFYYYNKILTGYWWTQFHRLYHDPLGVSILILWLEYRDSHLQSACRFIVRDAISSGMDNYGIRVLTEYWLDESSMSSFVHPGCGLTFTLWSFEIPLSTKRFIIESPMIKTFFVSLVTFFCFCGVFIPLGSLLIFSLTTSTSEFFLLHFWKLLWDFCKLLWNWELLLNIFKIILIFWSIWCCKKLFWFNREEFWFCNKIVFCF